MRAAVLGVDLYYPSKLEYRRDEVMKFAEELAAPLKNKQKYIVKVFENKRHDLMGAAFRK